MRRLSLLCFSVLLLSLSMAQLVSAQGGQAENGNCLLQSACTGCAQTAGCAWCDFGSGIGTCQPTTQVQNGVCPGGAAALTNAATCPAIQNPSLQDLINQQGGVNALLGNAAFAPTRPNMSRVNAAIAMIIILSLASVIAMVLLGVGWPRLHNKLQSHLQHQPKHFLSTAGGKMVVIACQVALFALILAALGANAWSKRSNVEFGIASARSPAGTTAYSEFCNGASGDSKRQCDTLRAGAALTLIWGLLAVFACTAVLCMLIYFLIKQADERWYGRCVFTQIICCVALFATFMMWALGAHLAGTGVDSGLELAASWGVALTAWVISLAVLGMHMFIYTLNDYQHTELGCASTEAGAQYQAQQGTMGPRGEGAAAGLPGPSQPNNATALNAQPAPYTYASAQQV